MLPLLQALVACLAAHTRPAAAAVALASACVASAQTSIALRPSVTLEEAGGSVALVQIADLTGPEAESLGATAIPLPSTGGRSVTIDVAAVRAALDARGVHWGRVTLRGGRCEVRLPAGAGGRGGATSREARPAEQTKAPPAAGRVVDLSGPPTLRALIARRLADHYGVSNESMRLAFHPGDEPLLATLVAGKQVDVSPVASETSARMAVNVTVYTGQTIALSQQVSVGVELLRETVVAAETIERGREIRADQVSVSRQWVSPGGAGSAAPQQVIGATAQTRLQAGRTISAGDVEQPLACRRGEVVEVHCLSGAVLVKTRARALGPARDGEPVDLKIDGSDVPFTARMAGRGRAVMLLDPAPAPNAPSSTPATGAPLASGPLEPQR